MSMNANGADDNLHHQRSQQIGVYRIEVCIGQGSLTTAYRALAIDDSPVVLTEINVPKPAAIQPFLAPCPGRDCFCTYNRYHLHTSRTPQKPQPWHSLTNHW